MKSSLQEEIMIPFANNILSDLGFNYTKKFEFSFRKKTDFGGIKMNFHFSENGSSGNNLFSISHNSVEKIILKVGLPNKNLMKGEDLLYTVKDKKTNHTFLNEPVKVGSGKSNYIQSDEDLELWKTEFKRYISNAGSNFITKYSSLENIHKELDNKFKSNEHNYLELLLGGTDHLFRFLIISKILNDPNFPLKLRYVENRIIKEKWIPYLNNLKKILDSL